MVVALVLRWVQAVWDWLMQWFRKRTGNIVTFDTGKRVVVGRKIAEGGFSLVFDALDVDHTRPKRATATASSHYALKRVLCPDLELLDACRREAAVHRAIHHAHVMPLLGLAFPADYCYMLFPYCAQSLRDAVNQRHGVLKNNSSTIPNMSTAPWTEPVALQLFGQICAGVQALHDADYSHRDIKLENVLLWQSTSATKASSTSIQPHFHPLVMDFGSAGPCTAPVHSRRHELQLVEQAASHTTLPYRPPELFDGGVRWGPDEQVDYRAVDVWSLGCTLHALLYGASPFECDFPAPNNRHAGFRIVECTHLAILGNMPVPHHAPISEWYSVEIRRCLLEPMLNPQRHERPSLGKVLSVIQELLHSYGHESHWLNSHAPWLDHVDGDSDESLSRVL